MNKFMKLGIALGVLSIVVGIVVYSHIQNVQHKKEKEYRKLFDACDTNCKSLPTEEMRKTRLKIKSDIVHLKENIGRPLSKEQLTGLKEGQKEKIYFPDGYWRDMCTCKCDVEAKAQSGFFEPKSNSYLDIVDAEGDKSEYSLNCILGVQVKYTKIAYARKKEAERLLDTTIMKKHVDGCISSLKTKYNSEYIESICRCVIEDVYFLGDSNSYQEAVDACTGNWKS